MLLFAILLIQTSSYADVQYSYDASGNRIKKEMCTSKWSKVEHGDRWFEVDANKRAAKHFDKKYGPKNNENKDKYHFDKELFINGGSTEYENLRIGNNVQQPHPVSGATFVWWDLIL